MADGGESSSRINIFMNMTTKIISPAAGPGPSSLPPPRRRGKAASPAGAAWPLVLASGSPRRAELLRQAGWSPRVFPSPAPEPARRPAGVPLRLWPACLAFAKARAVQECLRRPAIVLGADTLVVLDGRIINKASHRAAARDILLRLAGRNHEVVTGLALLAGSVCRIATAISVCRMRRWSNRELEEYLDSGLWRGKAGAYGIQDHGDPFVELLSGEFSNVVGLPMKVLRRELASLQRELAGR